MMNIAKSPKRRADRSGFKDRIYVRIGVIACTLGVIGAATVLIEDARKHPYLEIERDLHDQRAKRHREAPVHQEWPDIKEILF